MSGRAKGGPADRVGLWVGGVALAVTALLVRAGWRTGEWRGAAVSEVQVLVVAAVTYLGLRRPRGRASAVRRRERR